MISWADVSWGLRVWCFIHAYDVVWSNFVRTCQPYALRARGIRWRLMLFMSIIPVGVFNTLSAYFSLTADTDHESIESFKIKVDKISVAGTWTNISALELSSESHNIEQALPTEWSNYLLIGGSHVSRTITLANPLDGNFNRFNWNHKTDRNADCPSSVILYRIEIQKRAV